MAKTYSKSHDVKENENNLTCIICTSKCIDMTMSQALSQGGFFKPAHGITFDIQFYPCC